MTVSLCPNQPPLRFTTWLAPGLPAPLFDSIAQVVSHHLRRTYTLEFESKISGPLSEADDLFASDRTDIGFLCPPSLLWLTARKPASITLVPLAPVFDDARGQGRPVYFSDLVIRRDSAIGCLSDLCGRRVGYNDRASLSGYMSLLARLEQAQIETSSLAEWRCVGSHREALALIADGHLDAAAVDANVWCAWQRDDATRSGRLVSLETLGPFPVQPIVVRAALAPPLLPEILRALTSQAALDAVRPYGVEGFAPISMNDYQVVADLVARAATWAT